MTDRSSPGLMYSSLSEDLLIVLSYGITFTDVPSNRVVFVYLRSIFAYSLVYSQQFPRLPNAVTYHLSVTSTCDHTHSVRY